MCKYAGCYDFRARVATRWYSPIHSIFCLILTLACVCRSLMKLNVRCTMPSALCAIWSSITAWFMAAVPPTSVVRSPSERRLTKSVTLLASCLTPPDLLSRSHRSNNMPCVHSHLPWTPFHSHSPKIAACPPSKLSLRFAAGKSLKRTLAWGIDCNGRG